MESTLRPTAFIDFDHPAVSALARDVSAGARDPADAASRLFARVRDHIVYTVKVDFTDPDAYRASTTLARGDGFCIPKSTLVVALLRCVGIPARLHFADLRNRLVPDDLRRLMGTDVFVFHGYVEAYLDGRWLRATPSFDPGTCERRGIVPVEFDGHGDALLHAHSADGRLQFEYLADRGTRDDVPFEEILPVLREVYPLYEPDSWNRAFVEPS